MQPPPPTLLLVSAFSAADGEAPLPCAGNPAGVVLLGAGAAWPPTPSLTALATLLALPATVFLLPAPASEAAEPSEMTAIMRPLIVYSLAAFGFLATYDDTAATPGV